MNTLPAQKIIIEGAELVGKSFICSEIYKHLEPTKNTHTGYLLDGCHWFNCDVGIFGTPAGKKVISHYINIANEITDKHTLFEKFHISDQVYNKLYRNKDTDYIEEEKKLKSLGFKIVYLHTNETPDLYENRLKDRKNLYPHYNQLPFDIYKQQCALYEQYIEQTTLPTLHINTSVLPNNKLIESIVTWLKN
ncbi:MAG: hypothetical protein ACPGO5_03990 [Patescibacteria group bacterium]